MSMLEKLCDAKNTFEGKALAVFMAAVLAFSLVNLSSLADAAENGALTDAPEAQADNPSNEAGVPVPESTPSAEPEAAAPVETPAVSEAPAQSEAPATEPPAPAADLPSAEPGVAVVGLDFAHAYVTYLGQTIALPTDSIKVPLNKELAFAAHADEGYVTDTVKAVVNGVETTLAADEQTGEYKVPADQVTSNLTLRVEAKAAEAESPAPETPAADPITSDTKINANDADQPEADASTEGDDIVEAEADVSNPAFEGYAQAGNVLVKVTAAEGVLPEGTTVQAVQITSSAVIDAVEAAVEEKGKELENAVAVDVTLLGPGGNVIQPDAAVNVCFFNAGVSGEAMGVYHVANDGSSVSAVSARQVDAAAQSFDVGHFSIYVVTAEGEPKLATYNFYGVDGALINTQIVKTGEILYEPEALTVADGQFFQGWYAKSGEAWADKFADFGAQAVVETATYDLHARVSGACYVYFMDNGGRVYNTKSGAEGDVVAANVAFPLAPNESVTGWYTDKELVNKVDSVTLGMDSITLYPKVETGAWITFDAKGGTYTEPEFVSVGGASVEPAAPTRSGYRFAGWYADESYAGSAYAFGSPLEGDTTLHAKWEAATAKYSVAVWLEAADSSKDALQYDYVTTLDYEGATDEEVPLPSAADIKQNVGFLIDGKYILNESNESSDKTVMVKGDGSAIANVYLDRVEFTIDLRCTTKDKSENKKDYVPTYQITANYGADIAGQWDAATKAVSAKYGTRVWVEDPKGPGTTINPVVAPFRTMTEDMTLYYVNNGNALHHLELLVEKVGNTTPIKRTDPNFWKYNSGYRYQNNYDTSMFGIYDTLVFRGSGVHAEIQNYVNALNGFEWVGADLANNQGFFQIGNTWTARHYFERKSYTITFNNEGAVSTSAPIKYGTSIEGEGAEPSAKDAGVPEGSTFAGWYTSPTFAAGTEFSFDGATMPANNVVLYAKWILPTYRATYYQDMGGTALAKENAVGYGETTVDEPSSIASVPEGYKWVGWTTRSGSEGDYTYMVFNFDTQVYGDVELYPYYINDEKRSVSYDANGGVGEVPTDDRSYAQGSFAKVASSTLVAPAAGDKFLGWNTKADGSGATYYPGGMVQLGETNVTLYAQWGQSAPDTSLTYDPNGGSGLAATDTGLASNGEVLLKTADELGFAAPRAGVHFAGWNTEANGLGTSFAGGAAVRVDHVGGGNILYAQWALNTDTPYTVERYLQNLDGSYPVEATYADKLFGTTDQLVSADMSVVYPGFAFDAGNTGNVLEGQVAGNGSLVLRAYYERNSYPVSYVAGIEGASNVPELSYHKYGAVVDVAADATAPGYTFAGWSTDDASVEEGSFTMPAGDVTLTGTWTAKKATVEVWFYTVGDNTNAYALTKDGALTTSSEENAIRKTLDSDNKTGYSEEEIKRLADQVYALTSEKDRYEGVYDIWAVSDGEWHLVNDLAAHVVKDGESIRYHVSAVGAYAVTYDPGDRGLGDSFVDDSYFKGDTVTKRSLEDTGIVAEPGYTFAGWVTDDATVENGSFTMPGKNVVFTAQWKANDGTAYTVEHYKVSSDGRSATLYESTPLAAATGATVTAEALAIPGYIYQPSFNQNGMSTVASGAVAGNGSLVLKLYYTPAADMLTYDANRGTGTTAPSAGVTDGDVAVAESGFTREGFKFTGWNTAADGTGTTYVPGATYRLTAEDDVLYAQWTEQVTLTYDLNGGSGITPDKQQVDKGATVTEFATSEGFSNGSARFKGWAIDPNSLEPLTELEMSESETVYAIWVDVYEAIYLVQQYTDADNPSELTFAPVHPEGAPVEFEVKAGENFLGDISDPNHRLDWMPKTITTVEKGIDGLNQDVMQNFVFWDKTNQQAAQKRVSVYYKADVETGSLSDGDVTVRNADNDNYSGIRQGMVTVRTHYLDASGNIEHAQLTGDAITRDQGTKRSVTEQLYFSWQADNSVSLAVQSSSTDWVLNKVVRSDGGGAVAGGSSATLSGVAGNSTVDIYLTPVYTVDYFDATEGSAQALPELSQAGTVPVVGVVGGANLLPADMGFATGLSAHDLPIREGYTFAAPWNTSDTFDGVAVTPGAGFEFALFGEDRTLSLYSKGALNSYEITYEWNADAAPSDAILPTGGVFNHGDSFMVDAAYTKDTRIELMDEFGNVTDVYTFSGWNTGDFTVTGNAEITGTWTHTVNTIPQARVTYEWGGRAPVGVAVPVDDTYYILNQAYPIDGTYTSETVVDVHDEFGNVNGRYTFSGWTDENVSGKMVEGGVVVKGMWSYETVAVAQHKASYEWTGDVPEGIYTQVLPQPVTGLVKGQDYSVDTKYTSETSILHYDQYGNVDGHYTFSGWSQTGMQTMGDVDVVITGVWTLTHREVPAYGVTYTWTNAPGGDYEQVLPTNSGTYVKGQSYPVDTLYVANETKVNHLDAYGNVDGVWTFLGWNDAHAGVMVEGGATIEGAWSYVSQDVDAHSVVYKWTGAPTGQSAPVLPVDANAYVPGQAYALDATFTNASIINDYDAYGNVKGVWAFGGWNDPAGGTMGEGDVVVTGEWTYAPTPVQKHGIAYDWGTENIPASVMLPQDFGQYALNQPYTVDDVYTAGMRIEAFDEYHNLNGYYTFSGWVDPGDGVMGASDVTITGTWSFTSVSVPAYGVVYDWGVVAAEVAAIYQLPVDGQAYVRGQNYPLDATPYQPVSTYDAYGNVNGIWTFSGWSDVHGGVMAEGGVTVTGSWTYLSVGVDMRTVSYDWGTQNVPASVQLPTPLSGLVKGQGYEVDNTYTSQTTIETHDEFGNVNGRYTFSGWTDPAGGVIQDADVIIIGSWSYSDVTVPTHSVVYTWVNAPEGDYGQTLPVDGSQYVKGQGYQVDATYTAGDTVDHLDAYGNVDGTWTFEGWTDPGNGIMGDADATVSGSWTYAAAEVAKHQVSYGWTGEVPGGTYAQALPVTIRDLVKNQPYDTDATYVPGMTVDHLDQYGNVDGTWTFQGWNDPNAGIMGDADVVVIGTWSYEQVNVAKHVVDYDWGTQNVPAGAQLPDGVDGLVKGQPYTVDSTFFAGFTVERTDAFGNVNGVYTFSGWSQTGQQTMGDADVVITGSWSYEPVAVAQHQVSYEWTGDVPAGAQLPASLSGLVKGQPYTADATYYNSYQVTDATGVYTFSGWTDPNAGVMGDADVVLKGSWTYEAAEYTVVYNWTNPPATAVIPAGGTFSYGDTFTVDTEFTAGTQVSDVTGTWTFGGWSTGDFTVEGNATITGDWAFQAAEYVVRFVDYNDAELGTGTYAYGDAVTAPVEPVRADENGLRYAFAGWRAESGALYASAAVPMVTGNAVYTAEYTSAAIPPTPLTPATPTPGTPGTPAPTTPPGTVPEGPLAPLIAPIAEVLEDAVTPLAGPQEETIGDNENPLAGFDRVNCWVHYYLILGIIVTVLYGAGVLVRRINFTRKLKDFEDDVLGIEDESTAVPAPAPLATEGKEA